jgi:LacI family transcriptional regulator
MATIRDIAKKANVSVATVSAVVNSSAYVSPPLKRRVTKALKQLDYLPNEIARSLRNKKTRSLGVVIPDITNPFFTSVVRGIEDTANNSGYAVILCNSDEDHNKENLYINMLRSKHVDGLLLAAAGINIKYPENPKFPIVYINRIPLNPNVDSVIVNNFKGAYEATQYLIELGHTKIAMISGMPGLYTTGERLRGYKEVMASSKLPFIKEFIRQGNGRLASGYEKGMELLKLHKRPTAIFVTNNLMTLGVMKAMDELHLSCPQDVSIVGFDEVEWTDVFQFTTVAQPAYEMGKQSAELLISRVEGKATKEIKRIILDPTLKIRESCREVFRE